MLFGLNDFGVSISQIGYILSPATSLRSGVLPQQVLRPKSNLNRAKDSENITHSQASILEFVTTLIAV